MRAQPRSFASVLRRHSANEVKFIYNTKLKLLGVDIDNQLLHLQNNFKKRQKKIRQKSPPMAKVQPLHNSESNHIKNISNLSAGIFTINDGMRSGNHERNEKGN